MKILFKSLLFTLFVVLLSECGKDEYNPEVKILDENFLNALIGLGVDANKDGKISPGEAEVITFLDVSYCFIQDLTGIEEFVNLDTLYCKNNGLIMIDISNCNVLKFLSCSSNLLTSLDISNNNTLDELYCYDNQLTNLDVSDNTMLTILSCGMNRLTTLDVSCNTALKKLSCIDNNLTSLDVSNCTFLEELGCSNNQLTSLDVSNCFALEGLGCSYNQLTSLDISNNNALKNLHIEYLPDLYEVCVWELPFPPAGVTVYAVGSPNVYFRTDSCSGNGI